ncbi:MAG: hypothetical protein ABI596_07020 [Pyrinomonadaceae bacterium]
MKVRLRTVNVFLVITALVAAVLFTVAPVEAQCAMCRASVQNNAAFVRGLNLGVLILLTPPVAIFCSIFIVAYRYRKGGKDDVIDE